MSNIQQPVPHPQQSPDDVKVFYNRTYEKNHCYCLEILTSVYGDLIYHTSQAELIGKQIFYTIQRSMVLMMMEQYEEAIVLLNEVIKCVNRIYRFEKGLTF